MISCNKGLGDRMPKKDERGKYKIQVTLTEIEYQKLRKKAYEMEMTLNRALVELALKKE